MASKPDRTIEALLKEKRALKPPPRLAEQADSRTPAVTGKQTGISSPSGAEFSREVDWVKPWEKGLDGKPPWAKWV